MSRKVLGKRIFFIVSLFIIAGILSILFVRASDQPEGEKHSGKDQEQHEDWEEFVMEEEYNAGQSIIEHILDSHEWHIIDYKGSDGKQHHVSIPLPIILYHEGKLYAFWSSKLQHGPYEGFSIAHEGKNKGKIICDNKHSNINTEAFALPIDLSITKNVLAIFISGFILCIIFITIARTYKKRKHEAPKGLQSLLEPIILFIRDNIARSSIGEKKYERYMPYLLTLFFFILFSNLFGLFPFFPGGANVTGNIAVTGVMAMFTFLITCFSGNRNYWQHIINSPSVPWWMKFPLPLMPIIELLGTLTKPFVLMVRLFANMIAGHIIILGFISLIFIFGNINIYLGYGVSVLSIFFVIFISLLEILLAFIQAYIFTLLSALYFGMATEEHD